MTVKGRPKKEKRVHVVALVTPADARKFKKLCFDKGVNMADVLADFIKSQIK